MGTEGTKTIGVSITDLANIVKHLHKALNYEYPLDYEPFAKAYAKHPDAPEWIKDKYNER